MINSYETLAIKTICMCLHPRAPMTCPRTQIVRIFLFYTKQYDHLRMRAIRIVNFQTLYIRKTLRFNKNIVIVYELELPRERSSFLP